MMTHALKQVHRVKAEAFLPPCLVIVFLELSLGIIYAGRPLIRLVRYMRMKRNIVQVRRAQVRRSLWKKGAKEIAIALWG